MSTRGQDSTDDPTYKLGSSLNRSYLTPPARSSPRLQQLNYEDDIDDFDNTFVDESGSGNENGISNGISNENTDANADRTRDMRLSFWHQFVTNWLIMDPVLLEKYKSRSNRVCKKRYKNNFVKNYKLNSNAETSKFFYFFGARLQTTKAKPINVITMVLIIVPLVIYCVFEAKWQWHNVLPAIVIVFIYLWLLTFMNFCKAAMSDPGILPRNIHLPKTLESGKIINPPEEYFNTVTLPTFSKSSGMNGNVDKVSVNNTNTNNNNNNNNNSTPFMNNTKSSTEEINSLHNSSILTTGKLLSADSNRLGLKSIETDIFNLYIFQTTSGLKFILITTPNLNDAGKKQTSELFLQLYVAYSDFVMKNPFYSLDMPIKCSLFDERVRSLLLSLLL